MKWTKLYTAVALLGMVSSAVAGSIQQVHYSCGSDKACGVAPSCQPECCRPTICRPDCPKICTYQRNCGKPNCCGLPSNGCCVPKCGAVTPHCNLPVVTRQHCCPKPVACATAADPCCRPADPGCGTACDTGCCKKRGLFDCFRRNRCCKTDKCCETVDKCCDPVDAGCAAPCTKPCDTPVCAEAPCCKEEPLCCDADPCEVAHWIYVSQTACYARDRAKAIDRLGDRFDCRCNPEIMCAFIYGLNDADERVRFQAAQEIRQQVKCHSCCCNDKVVAALTCALADCDRKVRREAEKALCACGYDVIDCDTMCGTACGNHGPACGNHGPVCGNHGCGPTAAPTAAPTMAPKAAPAPTVEGAVPPPATVAPPAPPAPPAAEPEAYFPSKLKTTKARSGLKNLFGLR